MHVILKENEKKLALSFIFRFCYIEYDLSVIKFKLDDSFNPDAYFGRLTRKQGSLAVKMES